MCNLKQTKRHFPWASLPMGLTSHGPHFPWASLPMGLTSHGPHSHGPHSHGPHFHGPHFPWASLPMGLTSHGPHSHGSFPSPASSVIHNTEHSGKTISHFHNNLQLLCSVNTNQKRKTGGRVRIRLKTRLTLFYVITTMSWCYIRPL